MSSSLLATAAAVLFSWSATGGGDARGREVILGVTWTGTLVRIDPQTASAVSIGPTGYRDVNCMTKDSNGRLLAIGTPRRGGPRLIEIDPHTGVAVDVHFSGVNNPTALAFDREDVLYAVDTRGSVDSFLYRYDASQPPDDPLLVARLTESKGQSVAVYGMTFAVDGTLYVWSLSFGLMKASPATGFCVDLDPTDFGDSRMQSLAASRDGRLFGVRENLYPFDPTTGTFTVIGTGVGLDVRGAEFYTLPPLPADARDSELRRPEARVPWLRHLLPGFPIPLPF